MKKINVNELNPLESELVEKAKKARTNAYAPYSKFLVGAALLSGNGRIYTGCNVESVDLTLTTHAEMNAVDSMVADGGRIIKTVAVVMQAESGYGMPCGLCRQKILEFADPENVIIIGVNLKENNDINDIFYTSLKEIMPFSFGPEYLQGKKILDFLNENDSFEIAILMAELIKYKKILLKIPKNNSDREKSYEKKINHNINNPFNINHPEFDLFSFS